MTDRIDREPMPWDGPDYHADHAAWLARVLSVTEQTAGTTPFDEAKWRGEA